jgi:hypothetical protein
MAEPDSMYMDGYESDDEEVLNDDDSIVKWFIKRECELEKATVNQVPKKFQFGLILQDAYSLFPGEIRSGNITVLIWNI